MCIIKIRRELGHALDEAHRRWAATIHREPTQIGSAAVSMPVLLDPAVDPDPFDGYARYRVQKDFRRFLLEEGFSFTDAGA